MASTLKARKGKKGMKKKDSSSKGKHIPKPTGRIKKRPIKTKMRKNAFIAMKPDTGRGTARSILHR